MYLGTKLLHINSEFHNFLLKCYLNIYELLVMFVSLKSILSDVNVAIPSMFW